jgi:uncharacterized iron-regulated membrane protein
MTSKEKVGAPDGSDAESGGESSSNAEVRESLLTLGSVEMASPAPESRQLAKTGRRGRPRGRLRRKPVKRATIFVHRWTALTLGLLLLVITTTGAAVLYSPEWTKWSNESTFHVTKSAHPITVDRALEIIDQAHPNYHAGSVNVYDGLYEVYSADEDGDGGFYGIDPGSGRITGHANPESGVMAFMAQVHECFFTCDHQTGYIHALNDPVPTLGMKWLKDLTWGAFILGMTGLFLIFLAVSGIWLWWPGLKKWAHGFRVRWSKGRYARDYDLHQVVGMAAVPFLLMWGLTGASFEFNWVNTAWYRATGGHTVADVSFASNPVKDKKTPDIGLPTALAAASAKAGSHAQVKYVSLPDTDDDTATYSFYFARDFDQYSHGGYPGQYGVDVDRHDATHVHVNDLGAAPTLSNKLLDDYGGSLFHYGQSVNGWWRILWFTFGLTPLLLSITGVSTWLVKRAARKRRRNAARATATSAP